MRDKPGLDRVLWHNPKNNPREKTSTCCRYDVPNVLRLALILGLLIGIGCRCFDVPVPSPPKLFGALLVVAMTVGYMATDKLLAAGFKDRKTASVGLAYQPKNPDKP